MPNRQVNPNRMELLRLKKQLVTARLPQTFKGQTR